jgi:hypothetical protein
MLVVMLMIMGHECKREPFLGWIGEGSGGSGYWGGVGVKWIKVCYSYKCLCISSYRKKFTKYHLKKRSKEGEMIKVI